MDFPALVLIAVPRLRVMEYWRADLDMSSIRVKMMNLVMAYPTVTIRELAIALNAAYPDRPRDMADEGEAMLRRIREREIVDAGG